MKQTGTVEDYVQGFEVLVGQTGGVTDEQLLGYFLAGLQENIKNLIKPHDLQELLVAMRIARGVEEHPRGTKSWSGGTCRIQGRLWGRDDWSDNTSRTQLHEYREDGGCGKRRIGEKGREPSE